MVIRTCKVQMDVKPNLYGSLYIIPKIDTNGSKPGQIVLKTDSYIIKLFQNGLKWLKKVQNYRKWVKKFKNFKKNYK